MLPFIWNRLVAISILILNNTDLTKFKDTRKQRSQYILNGFCLSSNPTEIYAVQDWESYLKRYNNYAQYSFAFEKSPKAFYYTQSITLSTDFYSEEHKVQLMKTDGVYVTDLTKYKRWATPLFSTCAAELAIKTNRGPTLWTQIRLEINTQNRYAPPNPNWFEWLMGYPKDYTEICNAPWPDLYPKLNTYKT